MATMPVRIPASAFTSPRRRKLSLKGYNTIPPLKTRTCHVDDGYVPRASPNSIGSLRESIAALDAKVALLQSQRRELEIKLEQAVRLQSPVLRLPSELLSSIFIIGVLGMGDENPVMVPTLMLVCRYWAEVALNTPVLWAKISVSPHDSLEKARRRLERSKSCPLDIAVNFGPRIEYTGSVTEQIVHAMDLFRPVLWRTRSFNLSVPNRPQAHAALLRCREDAPLLETLTIQIHHSMQEDHYSTPPFPLFNGRTPRLVSCSLTSFNFGWDLRLMSRLRVLKLGGYFNAFTPSAKTLIDILRQCPELEELALRNMSDVDSSPCYFDDSDPPPGTKVIHLPRLTKASFYYAGIALTRQIMLQMSFPNLQSLEMCYLENVTPVLQILYAQALTRLPLRFIRIESCLFSELKFLNLLRHLPSLVTLALVDVEDVSSHFLKGLSSSQPWVCPRLETVSFDGCTSLDWDSLRTFVEARLPANPHAYARYHTTPTSIVSSASAAAAHHARSKGRHPPRINHPSAIMGPLRLKAIDVTRCNQISKEMIQWLRMYVAEVKCESAKGIWGEPAMS
ncbi:hypothetical protein K443DRAFT_604757 [Laccaria amethystina LaAM-08-1]|jgi:hypothetical protein|uniref:F-box domain-containing protein n=1 Tax=Laccaria amethystina LaAM-08-1 TaxID=1095629 RepID=A0A0C9XSN7_9AGAR|nr:hypothetical protein K443DRAFT_604757 [Laccaria amethystina LaAM-08-1]